MIINLPQGYPLYIKSRQGEVLLVVGWEDDGDLRPSLKALAINPQTGQTVAVSDFAVMKTPAAYKN